MSENRKHVVVLAVALLTLSTLTAALLWGTGSSPVLAAPGDLVAYKSVSSEEVPPGQAVRYTIVLTNTTSFTLTNASVGDALHSLLGSEQAIDASGWMVNNTVPGYITFTRPSLGANSVVTAVFEAVLDSAADGDTVVDNVATFSAVGVDASTTNNASFTVSSTPDLQIHTPQNGALITTRPGQVAVISGKAWTEFNPPPFPDTPELHSISYSSGPTYKVDWSDVATADYYVLYESTTGVFDLVNDVIDTPLASESVQSGQTPGVYYYRVQAYNSDGRHSRLSNMQGVTVTSTGVQGFAPASLVLASVEASPSITVEVSVDGGSSWEAATLTEYAGWLDWTYNWTVPEGDSIQQGLQARANYVGVDKYETDTITVTLDNSTCLVYMPIIFKYWPPIPYAPTLNNIDVIGDGEDLRVSWTYSDGSASIPDPTEYQLQEATDVSFTQNVAEYTIYDNDNNASKDLLGKRGTFYYRVRGKNSYGYGPWSVVKSISTANTSYYFDDGTEGWEIMRSDEPADSDQFRDPVERNGLLYHLHFGSWDFSILSPMEEAPSVPYTIEGKVDIIDSESVGDGDYTAKSGQGYGIVFGGNGGSPCPADRYDAGGCLEHYYRLLVVFDQGNGSLKWAFKRIEYHDENDGGKPRGTSLVGWQTVSGVSYSPTGWNTWRIEVEADNDIKIYFNDHRLATVNDDDFINDPYFGVLLESTEFGEVGTKWDYFTVEPSN